MIAPIDTVGSVQPLPDVLYDGPKKPKSDSPRPVVDIPKPKTENPNPTVNNPAPAPAPVLGSDAPVAQTPADKPSSKPSIEINFFPKFERYYTPNEIATVKIIRNQIELLNRIANCANGASQSTSAPGRDVFCPQTAELIKNRIETLSSDINSLNNSLPTIAALEARIVVVKKTVPPQPETPVGRDIVEIKKPSRTPASEPGTKVPEATSKGSEGPGAPVKTRTSN